MPEQNLQRLQYEVGSLVQQFLEPSNQANLDWYHNSSKSLEFRNQIALLRLRNPDILDEILRSKEATLQNIKENLEKTMKKVGMKVEKTKAWYKKEIGIGTRPWGTAFRQAISKQFDLDNETTSFIESMVKSMLHHKVIYIKGELLEEIKKDPDMVNFEKRIISKIKSNEKYKKDTFIIKEYGYVEFGGKRGSFNIFSISSLKTWKVAGNELTWLIRHARIEYTIIVNKSGKIKIEYNLSDKFDLRPRSNAGKDYNRVVKVLGFIYHDLLGSSDTLEHRAKWTKIYN